MFSALKSKFKALERAQIGSFGNDISTPENYRRAWWHFQLFDHAFLRSVWTNLAEISPGVWRSNQPSPKRIARYAEMGIKNILSLRGKAKVSFNLLEKQACDTHGIELTAVGLISARGLQPKEHYLSFLDILEGMEKPFLIHCKSGADRAGLASALYLMHVEGQPLARAKKQLSLRFMHLKSTKTGVLDHLLAAYGADMETYGDMPIRDWFATHYDRDALRASFKTFTRFP